MREVLAKLEQVQELDSQIGNILKKKAEFPKRLEEYQNEILKLTRQIDEIEKSTTDLDKNRKQFLGALELNDDRLKRSETRLEEIKTNQEYQALQKEIEGLKKNSLTLKESADKVSGEFEKLNADKLKLESTRSEIQNKLDTEKSKISSEEQGFDGELEKLYSARGSAIQGIDKKFLTTYDRVRQNKSGIGIAPAVDGNCRACNMRIPAQIFNELQKNSEMHVCPSCKRILFFKGQSA